VYLPYLAETQDEKMYCVVMDRERWFSEVMGEQLKSDVRFTDWLASESPCPCCSLAIWPFVRTCQPNFPGRDWPRIFEIVRWSQHRRTHVTTPQ
jgi:hypothetical protein